MPSLRTTPSRDGLVERVDLYRAAVIRKLDPEARAEMASFRLPHLSHDSWLLSLAKRTTSYGFWMPAQANEMDKVSFKLADNRELYLTPGNHSRLVRVLVEEFAPRFAPGGQVIYVGDTGEEMGLLRHGCSPGFGRQRR